MPAQVVLDEGHIVKNEASDISKAVRKLHCERALLLTGTPLQNDLHELWALLNFLFPDVFPDSGKFDAAFDRGKGGARAGLAAAHAMLGPLMKRRVKAEVEKTLPPKLETKILCPLAESQRWWYKRLLLRQSSLLAELERSASDKSAPPATGAWKKLQSLLMQLRKCCNHPYLFEGADPNPGVTDDAFVEASGKLHVLDRLLTKLKARGHRVVLFSQFTSTLDVLDDVLRLRGYEFSRLDGGTNRVQRTVDIQSFNAPRPGGRRMSLRDACSSRAFELARLLRRRVAATLRRGRSAPEGRSKRPVRGGEPSIQPSYYSQAPGSDVFLFLMSTRAGGLGVNLQTADTCVLFDSDWNPQADLQAMARVHRIGQTKPVHVYRLVTAGTVEERIVQRAEKKLYLDAMVNRDQERIAGARDDGDDDEKGPSSGELLGALTFGAAAIVNGADAGKTLSDADLDAILDRTRTSNTTLGCVEGGKAHDVNGFDSTEGATALRDFEGTTHRGPSGVLWYVCPRSLRRPSRAFRRRETSSKTIRAAGTKSTPRPRWATWPRPSSSPRNGNGRSACASSTFKAWAPSTC